LGVLASLVFDRSVLAVEQSSKDIKHASEHEWCDVDMLAFSGLELIGQVDCLLVDPSHDRTNAVVDWH